MLVTKHILGFSIGGLLASATLTIPLLLSPFILLLSSLRKDVFYVAISCLLGVIWVNVYWFERVEMSVKESEGGLKGVYVGEISGLRIQSFRHQFDLQTSDGRYLVSCYQCPFEILEGQVWRLNLSVKPFHSLQNPGGFDYRTWMIAKGYKAKASVRVNSDDNALLIPADKPSFRQRVSNHLSVSEFPILRALVLGDKTSMAVSQKRVINGAGLSHLFVVSGLHIGMAAMSIFWLLVWLQRPLLLVNWRYGYAFALVVGCMSAAIYSYISGLNTPALRSFIMLLVATLFIFARRQTTPIFYLSLALLLVLLFAPLAFFDMGGWLSFSIVAALIFGFYGHRKVGFVKSLLLSQWLAFCVGGLVLIAFGQPVSVFGLLANLILIPLVSLVVMPLALVGVLFLFTDAGWVLLVFVESALEGFIDLLQSTTAWSQVALPVHESNQWLWAAIMVLLLLGRRLQLIYLAIALIFTALLVPLDRPSEGGFKVIVLDVGQGSSALVQTRSKNILVDTGVGYDSSFTMVDFAVNPLMRRKGIYTLDLLHITHGDQDHAGGVAQLQGVSKQVVSQDGCSEMEWYWDDVLFQRFQAAGFNTGNNGSCLLRVKAKGGHSILFSGDIEKEAEWALVREYSEKLDSNVLVVPHHGSRTSSSLGFLKAVDPSEALISAGFLNRYGHPHGEIMDRYKQRSVKIYSTASHGAIEVDFSPRQANHIVSTYRPDFAYE